jgi:Leucine-rich repeat (LRR) protein
MPITVTYINNEINEYDKTIDEIFNNNLVCIIDFSFNDLTSLPAFGANMNFPNLCEFNCSSNQLTSLSAFGKNMYFPNLQRFDCSDNKLTSLPLCILNFKNLLVFTYNNNEIELSLQIAQFIDRIKKKKNKKRVKERKKKKKN